MVMSSQTQWEDDDVQVPHMLLEPGHGTGHGSATWAVHSRAVEVEGAGRGAQGWVSPVRWGSCGGLRKRGARAGWCRQGSAGLGISEGVPHCLLDSLGPHSPFPLSLTFHIPLSRGRGPTLPPAATHPPAPAAGTPGKVTGQQDGAAWGRWAGCPGHRGWEAVIEIPELA